MNADFSLGAIIFDGVSTTGMSLQDIIPYAPEGEELVDDMFTLQTFNSGAGMVDQWVYYVKNGDMEAPENGWYIPFETEGKAEYTFKPGEGFMFESHYGDDSGAGYTMAGQVAKGETKIPVNADFTLIGNIRPCQVDLQDIVPYAPEGEELVDDMFTLQTFNSGAGMVDQWVYYVKGGDMEAPEDGWYIPFEIDEKAEYTFEAGEGFMFESHYGDIADYEDGKSAGLKFKAIVE